MLTAIKQRLERDEEEGFTLIELMVVVLIIAILLAIAIPTFLGARNSANARAAQANLRNALTAEQTVWTNTQTFSATVATMQGVEGGINWSVGTAGTAVPNQVSVSMDAAGDVVLLQADGKDNNCYFVEQSDNGTLSYTGYAEEKGACAAAPGTPAVLAAAPTPGNATAAASITAAGTTAVPGAFYTSW